MFLNYFSCFFLWRGLTLEAGQHCCQEPGNQVLFCSVPAHTEMSEVSGLGDISSQRHMKVWMGAGEEVLHLCAEPTSHATLENGLLVAWSEKCQDPQGDISPYTPCQGVLLVHLAILHPCLSQRKHGLVLVSTTCTAKLFLVCLWSLVQLPWALSKSGPFPCSYTQDVWSQWGSESDISDRDVGVWLCSCASRNLCQ